MSTGYAYGSLHGFIPANYGSIWSVRQRGRIQKKIVKSQFVMNVGRVCKAIPAYLPHELLGYKTNDLRGMLLTAMIINEVQIEENAAMDKNSQTSRRQKFKRNK